MLVRATFDMDELPRMCEDCMFSEYDDWAVGLTCKLTRRRAGFTGMCASCPLEIIVEVESAHSTKEEMTNESRG